MEIKGYSKLTNEVVKDYHKQGFLVMESLLSVDECDEILNESIEIFKGNRGSIDGLVDLPKDASDNEVLKNYLAIHFPHKISEVIKSYASHQKVSEVLSQIISPNVKCMQTMLFIKAPGKPGQAWHQDEYYIPTRDKSLTGVWIALEDAFIENGCLWVVPGSHNDGFIRNRIPYKGDQFGDTDVCDLSPYVDADFKPVEVKKGSVIFFNGYLLHMSLRNKTADHYRRALVSHYSSGETMLPWDLDGAIEKTEDMRDIFMVAGKDPYEYAGVQKDITNPFLRAENVDYKKQGMK